MCFCETNSPVNPRFCRYLGYWYLESGRVCLTGITRFMGALRRLLGWVSAPTVAGVDNLAHGLMGAVIGYCGFRQRGGSETGRTALWTCIAAAEFPDIDVVLGFFGRDVFFRFHRSFTHSAVMLPIWAALIAWTFWELSGRRNFRLLWWAAVAGLASHLLLDWLTNYGTQLFWPLSSARLALSWVFIVDVYVWAILLIGMVAAIWTQREWVARTTLGVVGAYFLFCGVSRAHALDNYEAKGMTGRTAAFPRPLDPLHWTIVRDDGMAVHWVNGSRNDTFVPFHDEVLLPKAEATETVKLFRWFAAFPVVEKIEENGRTVLRYRDLRFRTSIPGRRAGEGMFVIAKVIFDEHGNMIAEGLASGPE
jgi:inner membrane protein